MATIFKLTITIGKGETAREREISVDPETIPMGVLEDLEELGTARDWKSIRPLISELFGLTTEEFRAMTAGQFMQIAQALPSAISEATAIPNAPAPPSA
jgi:hypothetical protein